MFIIIIISQPVSGQGGAGALLHHLEGLRLVVARAGHLLDDGFERAAGHGALLGGLAHAVGRLAEVEGLSLIHTPSPRDS